MRKNGKVADALQRWTLNGAAREFGAHREQLERRRRALSIEAGKDGCFSTQQIAAMIFGDKEAETIGKLAAERRQVELKNALTEGELISVAYVIRLAESFLVPVRQKILSSSLTEEERADMLDELVKFGEVDWKVEAIDAQRKA